MNVKKSDVWPVVAKAFPQYRGRKFYVSLAGAFIAHDLNWGGGTRNYYCVVPLDTGKSAVPVSVPAPWRHMEEGKTVVIPQGFVVVQLSIFCGKEIGVTIHANTQDMARLLPGGIPT